MENTAYENFVYNLNPILYILSIASAVLGIVLVIVHGIRSLSMSDPKKKYDYLKLYEIKLYRITFILFGLSLFFIVNTGFVETIKLSLIGFFVRVFIGICIATLIIYVSHLIFKFSFPGNLEKRLKRLRYQPRYSPEGNRMKLLSEEEEDVHLDEGMQAEEELFSVDYDVWVDEQTGYVKIEKYPGYFTVMQCHNCGFHTLRLVKEELIKRPTDSEDGEIKKYYACMYCKNHKEKFHKVAHKGKFKEDLRVSDLPIEAMKLGKERSIELVQITLHANNGTVKSFEFQQLEKARKFLDEYEA